MKISLNTNFCPKNLSLAKVNFQKSFRGNTKATSLLDDFFVRSTAPKYINPEKFDIKEYESLSPKELDDWRKRVQKEELTEDIKDNIEFGLILKNKLDKEFGQDKYVFVSIGTSPAPIGRVMEFSGVETKYLPISELGRCDWEQYEPYFIKSRAGISNYIDFLKQQKVTKEDIENSNKTYIFYDYTSSGNSLNNFRKFLMYNNQLANKNVRFRSLNEDLKSISKDATYQDLARQYIFSYLFGCNSEFIGGIPHVSCFHLDEIEYPEIANKFMSRLYNFGIIDALKTHKIKDGKKTILTIPKNMPTAQYNDKNKESL